MARLFYTNIFSVIKSDGSAGAGWKLNFYLSGTTTRQNTYSDSGLTVPNANPVVADANGRFGPIWLSDVEYKCVLTDANGTVINTSDPCDSNLYLTTNLAAFNTAAEEAIAGQAATAENVITAQEAEDGAVAALSGVTAATAFVTGYYRAARSYVPQGAATGAATISSPGSGGTNGTFALAFSGGNFSVNPTGTFTVSGGAVTAITITGPGIYIGNAISKPTLSFAASAGLTGAAGTFNTVYLKTAGEYYLTDHATDAGKVSLFQNQANAAVEIDASFDPFSVGAATNAVGAVLQLADMALQPDAGLVAGAWYSKFFVPTNTNFTRIRYWIFLGSGTCNLYVNVNDNNVLGPYAVTTTSGNTVISLDVASGSRVSYQIQDITGTPGGIAVQMEGLPY